MNLPWTEEIELVKTHPEPKKFKMFLQELALAWLTWVFAMFMSVLKLGGAPPSRRRQTPATCPPPATAQTTRPILSSPAPAPAPARSSSNTSQNVTDFSLGPFATNPPPPLQPKTHHHHNTTTTPPTEPQKQPPTTALAAPTPTRMSTPTARLTTLLAQLNASPPPPASTATALLSQAKLLLLQLSALTPATTPTPTLLPLARSVYEAGALSSIRASDAPSFRRYVQQLAPYYALPPSVLAPSTDGGRSKVTGLYLLLLLTEGEYSEFHSELEALSGVVDVEGDAYLGYPIRLERWLMEGSYDRVWKAVSGQGKGEMMVPGEEFGVFSDVCLPPPKQRIWYVC